VRIRSIVLEERPGGVSGFFSLRRVLMWKARRNVIESEGQHMRSSKESAATINVAAPAKAAPRLVKAAEIVAREVARALPAPKAAARPIVRMPRTSADARAVFDALFGEPARVGG
jgi:hypothetical protein